MDSHPLFINAMNMSTDVDVQDVYAEKQLYKGLENYFTNSIHYQEEYKIDVDLESCYKGDSKPNENEDDGAFNIEQVVIKLHKSCTDDNVNYEDAWIINESPNLNYDLNYDQCI